MGELEKGKFRLQSSVMTEGSPIRSMDEYQPTALSVLTGECLPTNHRSVQEKAMSWKFGVSPMTYLLWQMVENPAISSVASTY